MSEDDLGGVEDHIEGSHADLRALVGTFAPPPATASAWDRGARHYCCVNVVLLLETANARCTHASLTSVSLKCMQSVNTSVYVPGTPIDPKVYDLVLYLLGEETLMTRGRISLDWLRLMGNPGAAMGRPWHDVPTVMVSFGFPYYLYDAPRVPTYINAYMTTETMQRAVVDALLGEIPFNTTSPVDPFVGLEDARY